MNVSNLWILPFRNILGWDYIITVLILQVTVANLLEWLFIQLHTLISQYIVILIGCLFMLKNKGWRLYDISYAQLMQWALSI